MEVLQDRLIWSQCVNLHEQNVDQEYRKPMALGALVPYGEVPLFPPETGEATLLHQQVSLRFFANFAIPRHNRRPTRCIVSSRRHCNEVRRRRVRP